MQFTIEVKDQAVQAALNRLAGVATNLSPILQALGEEVMERTKQRFVTTIGPDGQRWKPNSPVTLALFVGRHAGKNFGKDGRVNTRGATLLANKRPLQGLTGDLAREFSVSVSGNSVTIKSGPAYAAIQQFGGRAGRGKKVAIPARPFLPVTAGGDLYPAERELIVAQLQRDIAKAIAG